MSELTVALIVALALLIVAVVVLAVQQQRQLKALKALEWKVKILASNFNAICSGAVGIDQRVTRLEMRGRDLEHRQDAIESNQQAERPYGEAIRLVHQGASASRLVEELGLTRSEAELVVMLHGTKEPAS